MSSVVSTPLSLEVMAIGQPSITLPLAAAVPIRAVRTDGDSSASDSATGAAAGGSRKRGYSEYAGSSAAADPIGLSRRLYPAFGGKCYRHTAQVYLAECNSIQERLQETLRVLPPCDQEKISGIWRAFASEPAERRLLILQGLVNLCCIPQLSYLNRVVPQQLRVDFLAAAPADISLKILSYLDATSLCQAAQVSRIWAALANADILWHRMCAQHIDKICRKCGWGLPLLGRTSRRVYEATARRALQLAADAAAPGDRRALRADPAFVFSLPTANVAMAPAAASPANIPRTTIPVSSLINPSDMGAQLVSTVCAPQKSIDYMSRPAAHGQSPTIPALPQRAALLHSDGGHIGDAGTAAAQGSSGHTRRRPWKEIFAERQIIANNWRKFRYHESRVQAHADGILCVQFNDDYMITGSYDSKVHVWNAETLELVSELTGHLMPVRALEFDDCKLFSGSLDGTVKIWNYRTGTCIRTLQAFEDGGVISLHHQRGTLVVGGENGTIRVYNTATMTSFALTGHTDWVNAVRLYGDNTLFSCSDDMLVKRWDLAQRRCTLTFAGHTHHVQSLQLSASGPQAAATSRGVRPRSSLLARREIEGSGRPFMVTGSLDSTIRVWDIETGECLDTVFGHVEGIWSMAFDALRIVSGSNDGTLKVWDTTSHACLFTLRTSSAAINCVSISDTRITVGDNEGNLRIYDFRDRRAQAAAAAAASVGARCA
ncbi:ubiquitin-binding SDF ubiquitin ligase complex subunit met30 [Coemansia nantahalensis]|uniref:Ubiquitin-binding SDF ubiquitin ligase complex subunit met30 n=1 Tax=Coemansia nantahalensis TaxID=2789366 RepID=A0ACC1K5M5_9FUNG|nr:ubiquitin-binding SDF ubiquitin ligase complex subunit met30 [Coemansia nantahalensis]